MDTGARFRRNDPRRLRFPWRRGRGWHSARHHPEAAWILPEYGVHRDHRLSGPDHRSVAATTGAVWPTCRRARMNLRRAFWLLPILLLPLPLWLNQYQQYVLNTALLYVPVGIGFNLVVGNLGLLAFSNVAYFGLGAYASGVLMAQFGVPWWITLLPAALIGG